MQLRTVDPPLMQPSPATRPPSSAGATRGVFRNALAGLAVACGLAGLLLASGVSGCKSGASEAPSASYVVRGKVSKVPAPGSGDNLYIEHEEVANFVNRKGEQKGMPAMTMPFATAPDLPMGDIAAGDIVEFTFDVYWEHMPPSVVSKIRKLPADTKLEL